MNERIREWLELRAVRGWLSRFSAPTNKELAESNVALTKKVMDAERRAKLIERRVELGKRLREARKRESVAKSGGSSRRWLFLMTWLIILVITAVLAARGC